MTAAPPSCGLGCQVRVTLFEVTSVTTGFWGGPGSCRDCETRGTEDIPVARHKKQSQMWLRQGCILVQGRLTAHWNHLYMFLEVSAFSKSYRDLCYREECLYATFHCHGPTPTRLTSGTGCDTGVRPWVGLLATEKTKSSLKDDEDNWEHAMFLK